MKAWVVDILRQRLQTASLSALLLVSCSYSITKAQDSQATVSFQLQNTKSTPENSSTPAQSPSKAKGQSPAAGQDQVQEPAGNAEKSANAVTTAPTVQVFLPPLLEKGKSAWGSMYGNDGSIVENQSIHINNRECQSDDFGLFRFDCPDTDRLSIFVTDEHGNKLWSANYSSTPHGLLVSDKAATEAVDMLDELTARCGAEPIISHAPSVIEPLQTFVIIGRNFSGKKGYNEVEIDGLNSDVLAASPRSLVVVSSRHQKLGAIKELKVANDSLNSLPVELDVCGINLRLQTTSTGKNKIQVQAIGSTLPVVIALANPTLESDIRFGGWRLGKQNLFLTPGGQRNSFAVDADSGMTEDSLTAHLVSNGLFDPYSLKSSRSLLSKAVADAEERAETIRLKKREIALQAQQIKLAREHQTALQSGKLAAEEESRFETGTRAVAARLYRIDKMLQARRAVVEGEHGGDFAKLLEAASNGNTSSLEAVVSGKDLGFTESHLLKVVGRRAREAQERVQAQNAALMYMPHYKAPSAAFLKTYRKKYGKKSIVPPPPATAVLLPPPAPYSPAPDELGPMLLQPPDNTPTTGPSRKTADEKNLPGRNRTRKIQSTGRPSKTKKPESVRSGKSMKTGTMATKTRRVHSSTPKPRG